MPALAENTAPTTLDSLRVPPHSLEAEQAVLGGLMLDPKAWDKVADRVEEGDFYRHDNRLIFRAIADLARHNQPFDAVTLGEWFDNHEKSDDIGGMATLVELANNTPSASHIVAYADIVRDRAVLRQLIDTGTKIVEDGYRPEGRDTKHIVEEAEEGVFKIARSGARGRSGFVGIRDAASAAMRTLQERYANQGELVGLPTGFVDLDGKTGGLQKSDLLILAGRPSMGKTALAVNIAESVVLRSKRTVGVFSMEMSSEQLTFRLLSSLARINQTDLRNGHVADEAWPRITSAIAMLSDSRLYIDDTPALSPVELRSRARRLHRDSEDGLGLIVIDYLQLMQVPGSKENRATEVSEISRSLKALAKELEVPVICLSQLNRALEQRNDKRPMMSDLRESGAIEQDADVIMFIYRDEYYHPDDSADKGLAEIIIGKQRNGPTGTIKLAFHGQYTRFESYTPESYEGAFE